MEETKKIEEMNSSVPQEGKISEKKVTGSTSSSTTLGKKKSNTLLYILIGILVFLLIVSGIGYFVAKNTTNNEEQNVTDEHNDETDEDTANDEGTSENNDDETYIYEDSTKEKVDGKLEKKDTINANFPSDLPLCGGVVTASSYDPDYEASVSLDTASSPDEVIAWYTTKLEEAGWKITEKSKGEPIEGWVEANISAEHTSETRKIYIIINKNPYYDGTQVTLYEYFQ